MDQIPAYNPSQDEKNLIQSPPPEIDTSSMPVELAEDKAKKANFGLEGKIKESYTDLVNSLVKGQENQVRQSAAAQIAYKNAMARSQIVSKAASAIQGPLNQEDLDMIDRRIAEPDMPESIFEDHFAKRYMDHMNWQSHDADSTGWLKTATDNYPDAIQSYKLAGQNIIAANQLINNRLQDVQQNIQDESWLRYVGNLAKGFIPGYTNLRLGMLFPGHGLEQESLNFHSMNRQSQVDYLNNLHETYKDNPQIESEYLSALLGQSTQDRFVRDLMLPVDIATMGIGTGAIKKALFPQAAIRDQVGAMVGSVDKMAAEIAAPAAAGDLQTAAIRRATDDTLSHMAGNDPRRRMVQGLWSFFSRSNQELRTDPGNFGAELTNQLEERTINNADAVERTLTSMMRGERVPFLRAFENIMHDANEYVKNFFPAVHNKILDISRPFKDYLTNTWHYEVRLGNQYTQYFETPEAAHAYAKQHSISGYTVEGNAMSFEDRLINLENRPGNVLQEPGTITKPMLKEVEPYKTGPDRGFKRYKIVKGQEEIPGIPKDTPSGTGYYISIIRPWNETDKFSRNQITKAIETNAYGSQTPHSLVNYFLGSIRSPEETMSLFARTQRGIATFGPNVLNRLAIQMGEDIKNLAKGTYPWSRKSEKWKDFERILELGRNLYDVETQKPGYTFKSPGELETAYRSHIGRAPDEQEVKAYFAWKQLNELDWLLRNLSVLRNKFRVGAQSYSAKFRDAEGNWVNSNHFDGMPVNQFPTGDAPILVLGNKGEPARYTTAAALQPNTKLGQDLISGNPTERRQVIQIYDQYARPMEGFNGHDNRRVAYVVGNFDSKPLDFYQLPRTGGGHYMFEYPFYLKQAVMSKEVKDPKDLNNFRMNYEGDKTLLAVRTRAEGKKLEKILNIARELFRDGKFDEAKQYLTENSFAGYDYKHVYEMFKPTQSIHPTTGKPIPKKSMVDLNEPIRLMDNNVNIGEAFANEYKNRYGKKFVNGLKVGNPASMYNVAFTGERDVRELMTIMDRGSKGNPVWNVEPAKMVDPIVSLNRGLSGIMNSFFFDDLRLGFMEHWLQEAKPFLDLRRNDLNNQAFSIFHNPPYIKGNKEQTERIQQLEVARQQHLQLVSRPGAQESKLLSVAQHLADAMYNKLGPKFVIEPLSMYAAANNGPAFLRGMAFHFKLGMFNPSQLLKQLNTWAVINGIEGPTRATQGGAAAMLHELSRFNENPEVLDAMSRNVLEKFGWKPGEFVEARNLLKSSGFDTVAGEYAARDNIWSGKVVTNGKQRFLSLGDSFFTEGERNVRYGAFYTSYRRFRDAHPTGALSDADKEEILQRARLLNVNMDRAANSLWQHGLSSIPFQFQTYALRTAELMFGKRLTMQEKARLIGIYSIMYGLPVAGTLSGFPIADGLRKLAIDNNYQVGDGYITGTLMEGVPAMLGQMITGNTYNIGEQYGGQGLSSLNNILGSDPTWYKVGLSLLGGPAGGVIADTWENSDPLRRWFANIYTDGYHTDWHDVVQSLKAISTIRTGDQTIDALQTGNWYSRKGALLETDIKPMDSVWMFLSGLSHQNISDAYAKISIEEDRKNYNKFTEQEFKDLIRKAIISAQTGSGYNPDQAMKYFQDAGNLLKMRNYPIEDYHQLYADAMKGYESLIDRIDRSFNLTHVPAGREIEQFQRYRRIQELHNTGYK